MAKPCVICGKAVEGEHAPFCSKRCADVDLSRWLGGKYAIPGAPVDNNPQGDSGDDETIH